MIELLVVIAVISILAAMLLPALNKAREKAHMINCLSNLKQIGTGCHMYSMAHEDFVVPQNVTGSQLWPRTLTILGFLKANANYLKLGDVDPTIKPYGVFLCPQENSLILSGTFYIEQNGYNWSGTTYSLNFYVSYKNSTPTHADYRWLKTNRVKNPSSVYFIADSHASGSASIRAGANLLAMVSGNSWLYPSVRHHNSANILYLDGHAGNTPKTEIKTSATDSEWTPPL
jgi:prepilin-type processing-associated H-X9-DG protein